MTDRVLARSVLVLALVGVGIATYLTYIHYAGDKPVCAIAHGCETVQKSEWSKLAGVPVAVLGLIGYVGLLASLLVRGENGLMAGALIAITGFGFSMYLTYREIFTIDAICIWCVGSAALMTLLAGLTSARLWRGASATAAPGLDAVAT